MKEKKTPIKISLTSTTFLRDKVASLRHAGGDVRYIFTENSLQIFSKILISDSNSGRKRNLVGGEMGLCGTQYNMQGAEKMEKVGEAFARSQHSLSRI